MSVGADRSGAIVVTVGDEILLGRTVDTNSTWLARSLAELGIRVRRSVTVPDNDDAIGAAVRESLEVAQVVVLTGGLGPTHDDHTREAVSAALGRPLEESPEALAHLEHFYRERDGTAMPEGVRKVSLVPRGGVSVMNELGTAPGIVIPHDAALVVLLPGVPREMKGLFRRMMPSLRSHAGRPAVAIRSWSTSGIPESALAPRVEEALEAAGIAGAVDGRPWELAFLPGLRGVALRGTVPDASPEEAAEVLTRVDGVLAPLLAPWRLPDDAEGEAVRAIASALGDRRMTVATAESCTGGLVAKRMTDLAGSSAWFRGGVVAYSNDAKVELLGVDPETLDGFGAVSEEVAGEMVDGAVDRFGTDCGIALTGIAGPGGGTDQKPVGTVCWSVRVGGNRIVRRHRYHGDREAVRERSAQAALMQLLRMIEEVDR